MRFKIASSHFALSETKAAIAEVCLLYSSSVCIVMNRLVLYRMAYIRVSGYVIFFKEILLRRLIVLVSLNLG